MRPKLTAHEAADHLIALAHRRGETVNHLKLEKLLYYAQAWHLAHYDEPLFHATFEAWSSGPVIPAIYYRFKEFGISPLPVPTELPKLQPETAKFLDEIADDYLPFSEWELEWQVHSEAPWRNARGSLDVAELCRNEVSEDDMRAYYRRRADAA